MCSKWSSLDYGIVKYCSFLPKPSSGFLMSAKPDFFQKSFPRYFTPQIILPIFFSDFFVPTPVPENCRLANFVGRFIPHPGGCPKCSFPTFRPSVLVSDLLPRGRIEEGRDMHMIFFCWVRRAPNAREHALPG